MDQAEHLRNIVKAQEQNIVKQARVITVTSGKGGVGKSNLAVNLGVWFRKLGKRVIIFDADFGLANVEVLFGRVPKFNLSDVIYGEKKIADIVSEGPMGIGFVSGGSGIVSLNNLDELQVRHLIRSLSELNELCDILIIDTGAGVGDTVLEFAVASPEVLLVTTPEPTSITDSYSLVKAMYKSPKFDEKMTRIRMVANKVGSYDEANNLYHKLNSVVGRFLHGNVDFLGMVPSDRSLEQAVIHQQIVSISTPGAKSSKAFEQLAKSILGEQQEINNRWGLTDFFKNFIIKA
ncbi:MAG: MinD/ParA family protein [Lachnospiraceae bacterium]|nr:MinD/ParA family protein [Lachnospiraceae bacterium]